MIIETNLSRPLHGRAAMSLRLFGVLGQRRGFGRTDVRPVTNVGGQGLELVKEKI